MDQQLELALNRAVKTNISDGPPDQSVETNTPDEPTETSRDMNATPAKTAKRIARINRILAELTDNGQQELIRHAKFLMKIPEFKKEGAAI